MSRYVEIKHENGKVTLVRADTVSQGRRKYVQLGFSLADVVSVRLIEEEDDV